MHKNGSFVSVVIPTYNQADYLRVAIQSVIDQTYGDYEILVINNFSQDHTTKVVDEFSDPRISLVHFHNHGIIAASRNKGIELAKGDLVAFLDSDDYWYATKLERCVAEMKSVVDVVCHGEMWIKNGKPYKKVVYGPEVRAKYLSLLLEGNCISTSATIVRKSCLEKVERFHDNSNIVTAEDYDLWLRIAKSGCAFRFIDDILGVYRLHLTNASSEVFRSSKALWNVVNEHCRMLKNPSRALRYKIYKRKVLIYSRILFGRYKSVWESISSIFSIL